MKIVEISGKDFFNKVLDEGSKLGIFSRATSAEIADVNKKVLRDIADVTGLVDFYLIQYVDPVLFSYFANGVEVEYPLFVAEFKSVNGKCEMGFLRELKQ